MTRNEYISLIVMTRKAINELAEKAYDYGNRTEYLPSPTTKELTMTAYDQYYEALKLAHERISEIEKLTWKFFE